MMKNMLKVYLWSMYILCAPLIVLWSIFLITWTCIRNKIDFGEFAVKDMVKAYLEGMKEGHQMNMCNIELIADE